MSKSIGSRIRRIAKEDDRGWKPTEQVTKEGQAAPDPRSYAPDISAYKQIGVDRIGGSSRGGASGFGVKSVAKPSGSLPGYALGVAQRANAFRPVKQAQQAIEDYRAAKGLLDGSAKKERPEDAALRRIGGGPRGGASGFSDKLIQKEPLSQGAAQLLAQYSSDLHKNADYMKYQQSYDLYKELQGKADAAKQSGDNASYFDFLSQQAGAHKGMTDISNKWAESDNAQREGRRTRNRDAMIEEIRRTPALDDYRSQIGMGEDAFADWVFDNYGNLPDSYKTDSLGKLVGGGWEASQDTGGIEDAQRMYADMAEYSRMSQQEQTAFGTYANMRNRLHELTSDEQEEYNAAMGILLQNRSEGELEEIAKGYQRYTEQEQFFERQAAHQAEVDDGFLSAFGANIKSIGASVAGGIPGALTAIGDTLQSDWSTANPYAEGFMLNQYANDIKAFTGEQIDSKALKLLYNAGMSTMENGARILATTVLGVPNASLGLMAVSSYGQSYQDAAVRGASPMQATLFAGASAALEVLTEKYSLESLLTMGAPDTKRDIITNLLKQGLAEASEEECSLFGGLIADALIMQDKAELNQKIQQLMADGKSRDDAVNDVFWGVVWDAVDTAIESGLSGAMMGSVEQVGTYRRAGQIGSTIMQDTARADRLRQSASATGEGTDAFRRAQGITMGDSPAAWGNLAVATEEAMQEGLGDKDAAKRGEFYDRFMQGASPEYADLATAMAMENAQTGDELDTVYGKSLEAAGGDVRRMVSYTGKYAEEQKRTGQSEASRAADYAERVLREDAISDNVVENIRKSEANRKAFEDATGREISGNTDDEIRQSIRQAWSEYHEENYAEIVGENAAKLGEEGRKGLASMKIGNTPGRVAAAEYRSYYVAGNTNADIGTVNAKSNVLTQEQRQAAYEAGKADRDTSRRLQQQGVKIQFRRTDAGLDRKSVPASVSKADASRIDSIGKALGIRISFSDKLSAGQNAYIDDYGNVVLSTKASRKAEVLVAHEITHRIQDVSPSSYMKYRDTVMQTLASDSGRDVNALIDETISTYASAGVTLNAEKAMDEMTANFTMDLMQNHEIFKDLVQKDMSLATRIRNAFKAALDRIKAAFGKGDAQQLHYYGVTAENMEKAVRAFDRMLADAKGQNRKLQKVTEQEARQANGGSKRLSADKLTPENADSRAARDAEEEVRFSLEYDSQFMDAAIQANAKKGNVDQKILDAVAEQRQEIANILKALPSGMLPPDTFSTKGAKGNTLIKNGSYPGGSEENTTICPRSMGAEAFMDMVSDYVGRPLTIDEQIYISQEMQDMTTFAECIYCYVAADRKAQRAYLLDYIQKRDAALEKLAKPGADKDAIYQEWLGDREPNPTLKKRFDNYQRYAREGKLLRESDVANMTSLAYMKKAKFEQVSDPVLREQYKDIWAYAQRASYAKGRMDYQAYNNHILNPRYMTEKTVKEINDAYGLRMYSFSDFSPAFILENMQMVTDAAVRGMKMLAYTKDINFARIFAGTGMNINMSCFGIANGDNCTPNEIIGVNWEQAKRLRNEFPNVGVTFVAVNDDTVQWALKQPWIDVVIPYHMVKTGAEIAKYFGYTNYTKETEDKKIGKKADRAAAGYQDFIGPVQHQNDLVRYLTAIRDNAMTPRFERFLNGYEEWKAGTISEQEFRAMNPNYMKLVNETRQSAEQTHAVQPVFSNDAMNWAKVAIQDMKNNGGYYFSSGMTYDQMLDNAVRIGETINDGAIPSSEAEGRTYSIEDSVPGISVTIEDVIAIRNIGKKSVNEFTSEDIGKAERWAKKFYEEMGTKSPFFRAWFGDWREKDSSKYVGVVSSGNQSAENGRAVNNDTGITMSWNVRGLLGETKNHAVKDKIAVKAVNDIHRIAENAILLDTVVSMPSGKSKMPNTAFMHAFYSIYQYDGKEYLIKLYAEQALTNKGDAVFTRAYQLKDIEKIAPIPISVSDGSPSLSDDIGATSISVAELYSFVKKYDKDFKPNTAPAALMNSNGTPKVFYRGDVERRDIIRPDYRGAIWATDNVDYAHQRGSEAQPLYVSMKNPYYATVQLGTLSDAYDIDETIRKAQSEGKDGAIISFVFTPSERKMAPENWYAQHAPETPVNEVIRNSRARDGETIGEYMERAKNGPIETHTAVWESGQYKNADDNIGTFDRNNPNTRYSIENSVQQAEELAVTTPVLKAMEELEKVAKSRDELWNKYQAIAAENASLKAGQAMQKTDIKTLKADIMKANERVRELNRALGKTTAEAMANARENRAAGKAMLELKKEVLSAQANAAKVGATAEAWKQRYREADAGRLAERMAAGREAAAAKRAADAKRKADVSAARQAGKDALNAQKAKDNDLIKAERLAGQAAVAAEKQAGQKALTAERQKSRDALKEARQEKKDALQQQATTLKAEKAVALAEAEQNRLAKEKELKQKAADRLKQQRENQKESADKAKYRGKVEKDVEMLRKTISEPTNVRHAPLAVQEAVDKLLKSLDFTSETYQKTGELTARDRAYTSALHAIAQAVTKQQTALENNDGSYQLDLPPAFIDEINRHIANINAAAEGLDVTTNQVYSMSADELRDLHHILKTITHAIRTIDALHMAGAKARVSDVARQTVIDMRGRRDTKSDTGNKAVWAYYTPTYAFERMGKGATQILDGLKQGQGKLARTVKSILDFAEKTYTSKEVHDWERERIHITLDSGETTIMTPAQIMSFAMLANRDQAVGHLMGGGMRLTTIAKDGIKNHEVVQKAHYTLTESDIGNIIGKLDRRQMEVAKALQRYMQETGGRLGNEITVARWDYAAFTEDGYFPIKTDAEIRDAKNPDQERANLWGLLNKDFTKALTPNANNALVVGSIFDTFAEHMSQMAEYNAFALPLVDAMKWFNYRETDDGEVEGQIHTWSVQKTLNDTLGTAAGKYFIDLMTDVNSGQKAGRHDDVFGKLTSRFKGSSVSYNVRVALQQPTAILRASVMIEGKYLAQGAARIGTKGLVDEMLEHSGIALWKSLGYYDLNVGRSITEQIKGSVNIWDKFTDMGTAFPGFMDNITWARIWAACKAKVKAEQGLSGDALMQATAKLFDDVCYHTQVADSVLTRNSLMRSKSGLWKEATSFMAEPTMSMNIIMNAFADYQQLTRHKGKAVAWGKTKTALMIGFQGYVLSSLVNSLVTSAVDAFRDDDDYETRLQKFTQALLGDSSFFDGNLFGELDPAEKIPLLRDVISKLKGYDNTNTYFQLMDSAIDLYEAAGKYANGKGSITAYGVLYKGLKTLSYLTGGAFSNIARDVVSVWNTTVGILYPDYEVSRIHQYALEPKDAIKNSFTAGLLDFDDAVRYLVRDGGFAKDEAVTKVYGWMDKANGGNLSDSKAEGYFTIAEPAGIPYDIYANAVKAVNDMSADKDANGKSISGSKKQKIVYYIMGLNLTDAQKEALWNCLKGTTTDKDTPWA